MKKIVIILLVAAFAVGLMACSAMVQKPAESAAATEVTTAQETATAAPSESAAATAQETATAAPSESAATAKPTLDFDAKSTDVDFLKVCGVATMQDIDSIYGAPDEKDTEANGAVEQYTYRNASFYFMKDDTGAMITVGIENYRPSSPFVIGGVKVGMTQQEAQAAVKAAGYALDGTTADGEEQYIKEGSDGKMAFISVDYDDGYVSDVSGYYGTADQIAVGRD